MKKRLGLIGSIIAVMTMVFVVFAFVGNKAQAATETMDATSAVPYVKTLGAAEEAVIFSAGFSKKGIYNLKFDCANFGSQTNIYFLNALYTTPEELLKSENIAYSSKGATASREILRIVNNPTVKYILVMTENAPAMEKSVTITSTFDEADESRAISEGEQVHAVSVDEDHYYTIKLKKDSEITITKGKNDLITLCDSKKKDVEYLNVSGMILKKGTYYLKVSNTADFSYSTKPIKVSTNTNKKKPINIKLGKKYKVVTAKKTKGKSSTELYYKIKLKKSKKISAKCEGNFIGSLFISGCDKKNKDYFVSTDFEKNALFSGRVGSTKKAVIRKKKNIELPVGSYLVEVYNASDYGKGSFVIK